MSSDEEDDDDGEEEDGESAVSVALEACADILNALDAPGKIALAGAAVGAILCIFPWYTVDTFGNTKNTLGVESWNGDLAIVALVLAVIYQVAPPARRLLPAAGGKLVLVGLCGTGALVGYLAYVLRVGTGGGGTWSTAGPTMIFWLGLLASGVAFVASGVAFFTGSADSEEHDSEDSEE